jgi:hypothetical protein
MTYYKHQLQTGQFYWSTALPHNFQRYSSFLSPTGWFTILALGAVVAGTALAFAT